MQQLLQLYKEWGGAAPAQADRLPGAGSNRVYYRLTGTDGQTVIGCVGTSADENRTFVYLTRHFTQQGLPVPRLLAVSDDGLRYLQTDLGTTSLFDALRRGREAGGSYNGEETELLRRTVRQIARIQVEGARGLDFARCYPLPAMDETAVHFDLNYFKYCFLKPAGPDFHELRLEEDFRRLAHDLTAEAGQTFLYRDCQARNVMLTTDGQPCFIDYQGGRRGPYYYDLASFLWQASARYPQALRDELTADYYAALSLLTSVPPPDEFHRRLQLFVLFRTLQVLGAYGYRGYFERKQHFLQSIPPALVNLRQLLADGAASAYPYLETLLEALAAAPSSADSQAKTDCQTSSSAAAASLVVRIFSFSYKKGIPADESGNGGGYVFDCRSTHNPGRYEPYKLLTGLDEPVIRFLEDDGEILRFLDSVYKLADAHVERYIERGFTSLMFSFGCTGGQHRSVYSAQHLAEHLHAKYGVEVRLCHREQGISQTLAPKAQQSSPKAQQ